MKSITIIQPWATLIALGEKKFETRGWKTHYRGPIAIHAGKQKDYETCMMLANRYPDIWHKVTPMSFGAVIATAQLVGCYRIYDTIDNGVHIVRCPDDQYDFDKVHYISQKEKSFGWYDEGRYAWELTDVRQLPEPIPAKGMQRLWNWEGDPHAGQRP